MLLTEESDHPLPVETLVSSSREILRVPLYALPVVTALTATSLSAYSGLSARR